MMKLSLSMIVKNEMKCLERCLKAAAPFVDICVIVDTGSTDGTLETLKSWEGENFHVFQEPFPGDFSKARNHCLDLAEELGATVHLMIDADEVLLSDSFSLQNEEVSIGEGLSREEYISLEKEGDRGEPDIPSEERTSPFAIGSRLEVKNLLEKIDEVEVGHWLCAYLEKNAFYNVEGEIEENITENLRIFPKGVRYKGRIHEYIHSDGKRILLPLHFYHDGYLAKEKGKRNLVLLEQALAEEGRDPYLLYQMAVSLKNNGDRSGAFPYFQEFLERLPEEDLETPYGKEGLLQYLYALLEENKAAQIEEGMDILLSIEENPYGDSLRKDADFYFVRGLFFMHYILQDIPGRGHLLPEIEASFLKCLEIGEEGRRSGNQGTGSYKALYNLGLFYEAQGMPEKAREVYQKAAAYGDKKSIEAAERIEK